MKRRDFLAAFLATGYSCDFTKIEYKFSKKKPFVLNVKDILEKSRSVGIVNGATLYKYPSNGDSINLLTKSVDNKVLYSLSNFDSLSFGETDFKYDGKVIYGIINGFKKSK